MKKVFLMVFIFLLVHMNVLASTNETKKDVENKADAYYENIKDNNKTIMQEIFNNNDVDIDLYDDTSHFNVFDNIGTSLSRFGYKVFTIVKKTYAYLLLFFMLIGWGLYITCNKTRYIKKIGLVMGTIIPIILTLIYFNPILRAL